MVPSTATKSTGQIKGIWERKESIRTSLLCLATWEPKIWAQLIESLQIFSAEKTSLQEISKATVLSSYWTFFGEKCLSPHCDLFVNFVCTSFLLLNLTSPPPKQGCHLTLPSPKRNSWTRERRDNQLISEILSTLLDVSTWLHTSVLS